MAVFKGTSIGRFSSRCILLFGLFQIIKIFSEDGTGKVVEIPADMTARDLCQLLVYKSHCVDDNSWALVEHHPLLGLGKWQPCVPVQQESLFFLM